MAEVKKFSDLGIKITSTKLIGQKQDLRDYLDKEIVVHNFIIKPSRYPGKNDRCLHIQYCFENKMYVSFSIATLLMQILEALPENSLPFSTTITNKNKVYEFN